MINNLKYNPNHNNFIENKFWVNFIILFKLNLFTPFYGPILHQKK